MSKFEDTILSELPRRPFLPVDAEQETLIVRRGAGPRQLDAVVINEGELLGMVDGQLKSVEKPKVGTVSHTQSFAKSRWEITHEENNSNVLVTLYDVDGNQFEPDEIRVSANRVVVQLAEPAVGRAVLMFAAPDEGEAFGPDETQNAPEELGVVVHQPAQTLPENSVRESGYMFVGSGIEASGFVIARNAHLSLAVGIRLGKDVVNSEDGVYDVTLMDETDTWNLALNAALLDIAGGSVLTNFYRLDVDVTVGDKTVTGTIVRDKSKFTIVLPEQYKVISDGSYTSDLSVYQAITDFGQYFQTEGDYTANVVLRATPHEDIVGLEGFDTSLTVNVVVSTEEPEVEPEEP